MRSEFRQAATQIAFVIPQRRGAAAASFVRLAGKNEPACLTFDVNAAPSLRSLPLSSNSRTGIKSYALILRKGGGSDAAAKHKLR